MQLVILVFFRCGAPHCFIFEQKEYPEFAAKLLNHTWSEHNEGWVPESPPELSKLDSYATICQGGKNITISLSIGHGVLDSIKQKALDCYCETDQMKMLEALRRDTKHVR